MVIKYETKPNISLFKGLKAIKKVHQKGNATAKAIHKRRMRICLRRKELYLL